MAPLLPESSVLIVEPTEKFSAWVRSAMTNAGRKERFEEIYFDEENPVLLIPAIGSFASSTAFKAYLQSKKEVWMKAFFEDFGVGPPPEGSAVFDEYFRLRIRDHIFDER